MTPENAVVADHHLRGSPRSAARTRIAHVARAHGKKSVHLHDNLSPLAKLRVCCACPAREGRFMRRLEAEQQLPRRGRKPMPKQLTVMGAIPCRSMRRLRVVPRKHTSGRLGSPSAATTSGCHAMAGRGCDEGGEIRWIGERVARIASRKRGPFAQNRRRWRAARRRGSFSPSHGGGGARHQSTLRLAARRFPHQAREKRPTPTCAAARDRLLVAV